MLLNKSMDWLSRRFLARINLRSSGLGSFSWLIFMRFRACFLFVAVESKVAADIRVFADDEMSDEVLPSEAAAVKPDAGGIPFTVPRSE